MVLRDTWGEEVFPTMPGATSAAEWDAVAEHAGVGVDAASVDHCVVEVEVLGAPNVLESFETEGLATSFNPPKRNVFGRARNREAFVLDVETLAFVIGKTVQTAFALSVFEVFEIEDFDD